MAPPAKASHAKKKGLKAKAAPDAGDDASGARASPAQAPQASPRQAPEEAPAVTPKQAPHASPQQNPQAAPGQKARHENSKGTAPAPPKAESKEKAEAAQRAIEAIRKGLAENPAAQDGGHTFIPSAWAKDFKPLLGPYRRFLERSGEFVIVEGPKGYTVHLADGKAPPLTKRWEINLMRAWQEYLRSAPKDARTPGAFAEWAQQVADTATAMPNDAKAAASKEESADKGANPADGAGKKKRKSVPSGDDAAEGRASGDVAASAQKKAKVAAVDGAGSPGAEPGKKKKKKAEAAAA